MRTVTLNAPSYWASYLINGDATGIDDESEIAAIDEWIDAEGLGAPVDCKDAGFLGWHDAWHFYPFASDCQEYTFLVHNDN